MPGTRVSLRRALVTPQVPVIGFASAAALMLPPLHLALDGDTAQLAVTACVVVLALAMAVAAALLALRGLQRIERRIQHVTDIARTVLTGDVLLLDEEEEPLDDPIGKLEGDLRSIAGALAERDAALQEEAFRQRFDGTVQRAMTMAQTELDVAELTRRTLETALPERASEVLIADASDAGLRVATGSAERPCCPVTSPQACFAVRRGQAIHFPNAQALDACPKLQGRERPADAAICVPVPVMGKTVGVLHATTPASRPFADGEIVGLESLVRHLGARLGMIRALETSRMQAETDALTGLLNRRSLAGRCQELFTSGTPVAMVVCDLDHFKHLNDTHGHDAGDCALRLFAQVVRKSVRPTDLVGRYGGEEFVLALPGAEPEQAVAVLQRVREALRDALAQGGGPSFTCSFGVAVYPVHGSTLHDLVKAADTALYRAKTNGRDRVEVAGRTEPLSTVQAA